MTTSLFLFSLIAVVLVLLLAWAIRPAKRQLVSVDDVLDALSERRHYARLPQILQSLRPEDPDYLHSRGQDQLAVRLRRERKRIALRYLNDLSDEYHLLLEASRILARVAPEVSAMDEFARLRSNLRFTLYCRYLRWRLWLGLQPWDVFGILSDMEGEMTLQLEMASSRLGEQAAVSPGSRYP